MKGYTLHELAHWKKSSFSDTTNCVEFAELDSVIGMRDSKNPDGGILRLSHRQVRDLVASVKAGEFDDLV
jgi:hypothetical protein